MFFVNLSKSDLLGTSRLRQAHLLGYVIHFDTTGIEFVMTALFVVMFLNQWEEAKDHRPALAGADLLCSLPSAFRKQQLHCSGHDHLSSCVLPQNVNISKKTTEAAAK